MPTPMLLMALLVVLVHMGGPMMPRWRHAVRIRAGAANDGYQAKDDFPCETAGY